MAYDAPDYQTVLWDASGKPYWKTASGSRTYIAPAVAAQYQDDPKLRAWAASQGQSIDYSKVASGGQATVTSSARPGATLLKNAGTWNSKTGQFDQGINWTNIAAIGIGGAIAAPFVVGALAGGVGGAASGSGYVGADVAGTAAATQAGIPAIAAGAAGAAPIAAATPATATAPTVGALGSAAPTAAPGAAAVAPAASVAPAAAPVAAGAAPAYGPLAGGYGAATTSAAVPASLASVGGGIAATSPSWAGIAQKAIPAASNIIGNVMQKGAIDDAVKAQTDSQAKALEAERLGGERAIGILSPWATVGAAANNRLGELLHLSPSPAVPGQMPVTPAQQSSANGFVPTAVANSPDPAVRNVPQGPGPYANWPIYQGPDGSKRRVDPQQAAAAESAGAKRIG